MPNISPAFTFTGAAGSLQKRAVPAGGSVTATLDSLDGITTNVLWSIETTDDQTTPGDYTLTPSGAFDSVVTFNAEGLGTAGLLKATVNNGVDPLTGRPSAAMSARAKFYVPAANGHEVVTYDEQNESSSTKGWMPLLNAAIRGAASGASGAARRWTFKALVTVAASPYTAEWGEFVLVDPTGGVTVNMPTGVGHAGEAILVMNASAIFGGSDVITVEGYNSGAETINEDPTLVLNGMYAGAEITTNGSVNYSPRPL